MRSFSDAFGYYVDELLYTDFQEMLTRYLLKYRDLQDSSQDAAFWKNFEAVESLQSADEVEYEGLCVPFEILYCQLFKTFPAAGCSKHISRANIKKECARY
ncbi:hypothetical protein TcBrA4_0011250 [Trypanosoma cruzi]|nr:hypothetical protein TcBrA4_0011250 [Trypanosoma cruzi]